MWPSPGSEVRGFALALMLCCANAFGEGPPPSANEAHDFLTEIFQRYSMGYVVWYGGSATSNYQGRAGYYGGRDCYSEVGDRHSSRAFAVDWSTISSVQSSGADGIYVMGQLAQPARRWNGQPYANFHLYSPDARVSRSVLHALQVLQNACVKRSRFD